MRLLKSSTGFCLFLLSSIMGCLKLICRLAAHQRHSTFSTPILKILWPQDIFCLSEYEQKANSCFATSWGVVFYCPLEVLDLHCIDSRTFCQFQMKASVSRSEIYVLIKSVFILVIDPSSLFHYIPTLTNFSTKYSSDFLSSQHVGPQSDLMKDGCQNQRQCMKMSLYYKKVVHLWCFWCIKWTGLRCLGGSQPADSSVCCKSLFWNRNWIMGL